jgi:hypothetical protein
MLDDGLDLPEDRGKDLDPQPLQAGPVFLANSPADDLLNTQLPEIKDFFIRCPMADVQFAAFRQLRPMDPQDQKFPGAIQPGGDAVQKNGYGHSTHGNGR